MRVNSGRAGAGGGPGRVGRVLMDLVNTHTGGPGDQVGALCPKTGSAHLPVRHSGCYLVGVRSEGCCGCWKEMDDSPVFRSDAVQVS